MQISEYAIIISTTKYGENSAIISVFSQTHGILKGFVRRAKTKNNPTIFATGNVIKMTYFARENTLGSITGESYKMYIYSCMNNEAKMKLILAICNILNTTIISSEKNEFGDLFKDIILYLEHIKHDTTFENNLFNLAILIKQILHLSGYGFRLNKCIVTENENIDDLIFLSPKSAASVSKQAGLEYSNLMFDLPKAFITNNYQDIVDKNSIISCIKIVDFFIKKNFNTEIEELKWFIEKNKAFL